MSYDSADMRILLIRHGVSAHVHRGGLLDSAGMHRWREAYDAAGIVDTHPPPPRLLSEIAKADVVGASDLPRAIASAEALAAGRQVLITPLLREEPLPIPAAMKLPMPLGAWNVILTVSWFARILRGVESSTEDRDRARKAAAWCRDAGIAAAGPEATVAVVTHGVFRRTLARQLAAEGWSFAPGKRSYDHWSVWELRSSAFSGQQSA